MLALQSKLEEKNMFISYKPSRLQQFSIYGNWIVHNKYHGTQATRERIITKLQVDNLERKHNITIPVKQSSYVVLGLKNLKRREGRGEEANTILSYD